MGRPLWKRKSQPLSAWIFFLWGLVLSKSYGLVWVTFHYLRWHHTFLIATYVVPFFFSFQKVYCKSGRHRTDHHCTLSDILKNQLEDKALHSKDTYYKSCYNQSKCKENWPNSDSTTFWMSIFEFQDIFCNLPLVFGDRLHLALFKILWRHNSCQMVKYHSYFDKIQATPRKLGKLTVIYQM